MNKIFRLAYVAFVGVLALMVSSCTDDYTYDKPASPSGMQAYFANTLPSQYNLSDNDSTSFQIPVSRVDVSEAATVNITFSDTTNTFSAPASVSFAAGDSVAYLPVTYRPSSMEYDDYKTVTLTIADANYTTPYGNSTYTFRAAKASPYKSLGTNGIFQDGFIMSNAYYVDIRQNTQDPTLFRVMNPYDGAVRSEYGAAADGNQTEYIQLKLLKKGDTFAGQTIQYDDLVYFNGYNTGFFNTSNDYNKDIMVYHPATFQSTADQSNWTHNKVLAYQDNGLPGEIQLAPFYYMEGLGGWNETQQDGYILILFPGFTPSDYNASAQYQGRFIDPNDSCSAQFNISLGSDVASAKATLVKSTDWNGHENSIINAIDQDSIASTTITESGTYNFSYSESGKYVLVVVTYDSEGTAQSYYVTDAIQLNNGTGGEPKETFTDVAAGTLTLGVQDLSANFSQNQQPWGLLLQQTVTQEAVLSQSSTDPTRFRLTPYISEDYPLYFNVDENGTITVDQCDVARAQDGMVQASDIVTWYKAVGSQDLSQYFPSTYDASKQLYTFDMTYHAEGYQGYYGIEQETFEVTATGAKAVKVAMASAKKAAANKTSFKKHNLKKIVGGKRHFVRLHK